MANGVFNIALGKAGYYATQAGVGNAALVVVLMQAAAADATLDDYDTLALLLAGGGNTEATFTNYARKTITSVTNTIDDATGTGAYSSDFADQTWATAGGATNNTLVKALICYDPNTTSGTDSEIIPLTYHDFAATTNGADLTMQLDPLGWFGAS